MQKNAHPGKISKAFQEKRKFNPRKSEDSSRCVSTCTKSTSSSKPSPIPDKDLILNPYNTSTVKELSCDSDASAVEDPAPLLANYINSKDILLGMGENIRNTEVRDIRKWFNHKTSPTNEYQPKIKKEKSFTVAYQKIKRLRTQISELTLRASLCESELKSKEKENSELKTMVSSLREVVTTDNNITDKTSDSTCKSCEIF